MYFDHFAYCLTEIELSVLVVDNILLPHEGVMTLRGNNKSYVNLGIWASVWKNGTVNTQCFRHGDPLVQDI